MNPSLRRVLCVEDDPDVQAVARLALEAVGGFEVETCSNGVEALKRAGEFAPDLILMDVMMPELDGPGTLKALRNDPGTRSIPVVFMTAKVQAQEVEQYRKLGAVEVVSKPFDPMTLSRSLVEIWNDHLTSGETGSGDGTG